MDMMPYPSTVESAVSASDPGVADLETMSLEDLETLADAAREIALCNRVLAKTGDNVVGEILRGAGPFYEWRHYPANDVYDSEYHSQYYYHAHPPEERVDGEHGHFHTFMRPLGMPPGVVPAPLPDLQVDEDGNGALSHLIGISMDKAGRPIRLFTTNRWVTGETWYQAEDVIRMLDGFAVDHARPSWPANRWLTALLRLYKPQIVDLLRQRDVTIARHAASHPGVNVFEDRGLEVTSEVRIDLEERLASVEAAARRARRRDRKAQALG